MHWLGKVFVAILAFAVAATLYALRRGVFLVGASTVVEDAKGIPEKVRHMTEFIQNQPAAWFYGSLALLILLGIALLIPPDQWRSWVSRLSTRGDLASAPKDHNITSYGQSGGITAHTAHSDRERADVKRQEQP